MVIVSFTIATSYLPRLMSAAGLPVAVPSSTLEAPWRCSGMQSAVALAPRAVLTILFLAAGRCETGTGGPGWDILSSLRGPPPHPPCLHSSPPPRQYRPTTFATSCALKPSWCRGPEQLRLCPGAPVDPRLYSRWICYVELISAEGLDASALLSDSSQIIPVDCSDGNWRGVVVPLPLQQLRGEPAHGCLPPSHSTIPRRSPEHAPLGLASMAEISHLIPGQQLTNALADDGIATLDLISLDCSPSVIKGYVDCIWRGIAATVSLPHFP